MHAIRRVCLTQPSALRRRQMCAVVGTSRGVGASTAELRVLTGGHFSDLGVNGIYVSLGRDQSARRIPVRYEWEDLVREGLQGLGSRELLFGIREDHRNVAARVIEGATILGSDCPRIDAARLRSTWLADLMMDTIPVNVILYAAGLRSARSLTDIADWLQRTGQVQAATSLRGERP